MHPIRRHRQQGLTLVELLVGLLVGIVVLGAAASAFLSAFSAQTDNLGLTRLNQDMRTMVDIMARDIRRAGFSTSDPDANVDDLVTNPFFASDKDIRTLDSGTCIVYSYNQDDDSPVVVDNEEHFGFRLSNNIVQMRTSGTSNTSCSNGSWETITEPDVEITNLSFSMASNPLNVTSMVTDSDGDGNYDGDDNGNGQCDTGETCKTCTAGSGDACLYVRTVTINLSGRLKDDNSVSQTITHQLRIRNDKFIETL